MEKVAIITDSTCQLSKEEANARGLFFLPLHILANEDVYRDGVDINSQELFKMMKEDKNINFKTSLPTAGEILEVIHEIKSQGYTKAIPLVIAAGLSSTKDVIVQTGKAEGLEIINYDSRTVAKVLLNLISETETLLSQGVAIEDITRKLDEIVDNSATLIVVKDLNHLKKGGRITPAAALLAGMLKVVPILTINTKLEGKIDTLTKVRTHKKALLTVVEMVKEHIGSNSIDDYEIVVQHADAEVDAQTLKDYVKEMLNVDPITRDLAAIFTVHTGIDVCAIEVIKK